MKPGLKTTEFWLTLLAAIAATALAHFDQVEGSTAVIATAVLTAIYTILRASLKNKA
jgi:hypothetical protein